MTDDVLTQLRRVCAELAATPHDPVLAAGGRCGCLPCRTERLAARGWPAGTLGSGSRSSDTTSSTERAAGLTGNEDTPLRPPEHFAGLDERLATHLNRMRADALAVQAIVAIVASHASDDDPIPAGRGHCHRCETFCMGDGANDRLRAGLCDPCNSAWKRWRRHHPHSNRADFIRATRPQRPQTNEQVTHQS